MQPCFSVIKMWKKMHVFDSGPQSCPYFHNQKQHNNNNNKPPNQIKQNKNTGVERADTQESFAWPFISFVPHARHNLKKKQFIRLHLCYKMILPSYIASQLISFRYLNLKMFTNHTLEVELHLFCSSSLSLSSPEGTNVLNLVTVTLMYVMFLLYTCVSTTKRLLTFDEEYS